MVATSSTVFAGGGFTTVAGKSRLRLAAFSRAGALLTFPARTNGEVSALALSAGRLYVGGTFTQASGRLRSNAAAFVIRNGLLSRWNPSPNGRVTALMTQPTRIFLGGFFTTVKGQASRRLAAVAPVTGNKLRWRGHPSGQVLSLAQQNGAIYRRSGWAWRGDQPVHRHWSTACGCDRSTATSSRSSWSETRCMSEATSVPSARACRRHCATLIPRRHLLSLKTANGDLTAWNPEANSALGVYILKPREPVALGRR